MKLSRALSALLPSSSSQAGKWPLLRTAAALQASSLSTAAAAKPAARKSARAARDRPREPTQPDPSGEEGEHGGSPPQAPANAVGAAATRLPKLTEIPWQTKVANSVHLIGRLGAPIELGASPDGTYTAVSVLLHEKTYDLPHFCIPLVFQGDLAQIAACNLKETDHLYVTGLLNGGSQIIDNNAETKVQVMVHSISYVLDLHSKKKHDRNSEQLDSTSAEAKDAPFDTELWNDLFAHPHEWLDYRTKGNKKSGAFKHKATGKLLEINESTPEWVLSKLDIFCLSSKTSSINSESANTKNSRESLVEHWSDLFENPQLWWDNREDKLNGKIKPKWPDFSHKRTRQGLWLYSAPDWVLPKLESAVVSAETCWQREAKKTSTTLLSKKEESWRNLMENQGKWWDQRSKKSNPKAPDFKHKETGEGLWLNSTTTPKWVVDKFT